MKLINNKKITFLDNIIIDKDLQKYKKLKKENKENISKSVFSDFTTIKDFINNYDSDKFNIKISGYLLNLLSTMTPSSINNFIWADSSEDSVNSIFDTNLYNNILNSKTFFGRIKNIFYYLFSDVRNSGKHKKIKDKSIYTLNILQLFESIKIESNKEKDFIERVDQYICLIKKAQLLHQKAQEEKLITNLVIHIYESILSVNGFNKYITKDDLYNLQSKCSIVLDIDYIKNFVRVIPDEVAYKKSKADELLVFDNYCVLYFDPSGKSYSETEEEKIERIKKDPILFGVISGSDKLYYIDSWIDEYCDLTLNQVIDKLGKVKEL